MDPCLSRRNVLGTLGTVALAGCNHPSVSDERNTQSEDETMADVRRTPTETATRTPAPEPETRDGSALLGLFMGDPTGPFRQLDAYEHWSDTSPAVLTLFVTGLESHAWTRTFVRNWMTKVWNHGHVPLVTWMPQPETRAETPTGIERRIAAGEYDRMLTTWADEIASWTTAEDHPYERRVYFRPAHEMNGVWFPWSATDARSTPEDYVAMWRRMHAIFADTRLSNDQIQWMWSPNASGIGEYGTEPYYPGDEYVDWIGIDGFNFGDVEDWSNWSTPASRFDDVLRTVREITDTPIALSEVATSSYRDGEFRPRDKAEWIRRCFEYVAEENIKMVSWFNVDKRGERESDWAAFGGARGTDKHTIENRTYHAYDAFREKVNEPTLLSAYPDYSRRLTDAEFAGTF